MQVRKKTLQRGKEHQVSEQKSYFNKWKVFEEKINIFLSVDSLHSPWCLFKSIKNRSLFLEHQQVFCDPASISKYIIYHSYKYFHLEAGKPQIWGYCRFWNREGGSFRFYQIFRFCRVFVLQNFSSYVPLSSGQAWHGPPAPPACPHTLHNRLNRQMCSLHVELLGNPHEQVQFSIVCQAHKAQGGCWKPRGWELEQKLRWPLCRALCQLWGKSQLLPISHQPSTFQLLPGCCHNCPTCFHMSWVKVDDNCSGWHFVFYNAGRRATHCKQNSRLTL